MNASKSIVWLISVCILAPLVLGFAWPTSAEEVDQYEIGDGVDITDAASTDQVPIFTSYSGFFNSIFMAERYTTSGDVVVVNSEIPKQLGIKTIGTVPVYNESTTETSISMTEGQELDLSALTIAEGVTRISFDFPGMFEIEGHGTADTLVYFPNTQQVVYSDTLGGNAGTVNSSTEITASTAGTVSREDHKVLADTFVNLDLGFWVPVGFQWYNGFLNSSATFMIHPLLNQTSPTGWSMAIGTWDGWLWLRAVDGMLQAGFGNASEAEIEWTDLGGWTAYPNIRVTLDAPTGTVTVEGLIGMDTSAGGFGFTAASQTPGRTLTFETSRTDGFTVLDLVTDWPQGAAYLVTSTMSQIGSRPGLVDATVEGDAYHPDGNWQLFIGDTSVFGDTITIGGSVFEVSPAGEITVNLADGGTETIRLRDLTILSVEKDGDRTIYLDGREILTASDSGDVVFEGAWMCDLYLFDMDIVPKTLYSWTEGGFGFDMAAFCFAGLITDVIGFIALALHGRGMGQRILPLLITFATIAAFYIIMMM